MPNKDKYNSQEGISPIGLEREDHLLDLFPEISPYSTGFLDVDDTHSLYWEQSGNPDGVPVLLLHGGPGEGSSPLHRRFFDPDYYRIILYDQRGAGKSQPHGGLENNTIPYLLEDIEKLRNKLRIEKWHIFGGSWGSTLALSYAQQHPNECLSLILRSIFLMEEHEINWFIYGTRNTFPEAWEQFAEIVPENRKDDILNYYYETLMNDDDRKEQMKAAVSWCLYEAACVSLIPNYDTITSDEQKEYALSMAKIEAYYFKNETISPEKSLLNGIDQIRAIPTTIIHGRYDMISPLVTAHKLHQSWPEADYIIVPDGGHSALDPAIRSRLIEATENAKTITRQL